MVQNQVETAMLTHHWPWCGLGLNRCGENLRQTLFTAITNYEALGPNGLQMAFFRQRQKCKTMAREKFGNTVALDWGQLLLFGRNTARQRRHFACQKVHEDGLWHGSTMKSFVPKMCHLVNKILIPSSSGDFEKFWKFSKAGGHEISEIFFSWFFSTQA